MNTSNIFLLKLSYLPSSSFDFDSRIDCEYDKAFNDFIRKNNVVSLQFTNELNKLGYPSKEIFYNYADLQTNWLKKHKFDHEDDLYKILSLQISYYKPEYIYFENLYKVSLHFLKWVKSYYPNIKIISWHCTVVDNDIRNKLHLIDGIITCIPSFGSFYNKIGISNFVTLYPFCDNNFYRSKRITDKVFFSGSLYPGQDFHDDRCELLLYLKQMNIPLDIFSQKKTISKNWLYKVLHLLPVNDLVFFLKKYSKDSRINRLVNFYSSPCYQLNNSMFCGYLTGRDRLKKMGKYNLVLNKTGGLAPNEAGNMTLTEATGVGSCLITDMKDNLPSLFKIDHEIIAYNSKDDCAEKLKWLINNPNYAINIGKNARKRTLLDYSYTNFVKRFLETFLN